MSELLCQEQFFLGQPLRVQALHAGSDLVVVITGGCLPHVGGVSAAFWENGAVRCETSGGRGHYDHIISEKYARQLATACQGNVSASCGIHYDQLSKDDLDALLLVLAHMLDQLIVQIHCC